MIVINNVEIFGWEAAIRGMRNPMNSWYKSDSCRCYGNDCEMVINNTEPVEGYCPYDDYDDCDGYDNYYCVGKNDYKLMLNLSLAGTDHSKYLRMITVTLDINAPLYWWKEFDTYKVGTVANSCSTMHKIQAKEFELDDFSHEHLDARALMWLRGLICELNYNREDFINRGDKAYWWNMIQLLPTSYNQKRTVQLNYQVLKNIYHSRKAHKLDEWRALCEWIESLPYSRLIIGVK